MPPLWNGSEEVRREIKMNDLELLQLQAGFEGQMMLKDKSPEYQLGFLAGCLYLICDKTARENAEIAENMKDYWKSLNSGAE